MGVVFRQSVKNTIVTGVGAMLGGLVIWLSTKYIPKQQLGFLGNLTNYAVAFSQFLLLGLNSTMSVYVHKYVDDPRKKKLLFSMSVVIPTLVTIVGTIIYYFAKESILKHFQPADIPFMRQYFMWLPLFALLFIYMVTLELYLSSPMRVAMSAFMREVLLRLLNNCTYILLWVWRY
jgi:O-antigen/teichoic acid export membrane protein